MSIPGLPKTSPFHYKQVNGQMGSVLVHANEIFLVTINMGLISVGKPFNKPIPACVMSGITVESKPIDYTKNQVINGRFFGWQEEGEHWLFIQPQDNSLGTDREKQNSSAFAVLYYKC
jgi:hypothetical protein